MPPTNSDTEKWHEMAAPHAEPDTHKDETFVTKDPVENGHRWSVFKAHGVEPEDGDQTPLADQVELEAGNAIKYRTCSWQKTALLLFSEYICLAVTSFPYSYSVLGLIPGLIVTIVVAALVLYTSYIIWQYCLHYPHIRDVCDIGQHLFWNSKVAWYLTATMFLLNNTFIQGLHCLVGAQYLNLMTNHGACTIAFSAVTAIFSFFCSLPRTFNSLAKIGAGSAFFTFLSLLVLTICVAKQEPRLNYAADPSQPRNSSANGAKVGKGPGYQLFPAENTTYVAGMGAFLNISYTLIGQITLPSFIAEMKNPKEFHKALLAVTIAEIILFSIVGSVIYVYAGQYVTSPAFYTLIDEGPKKATFSLMVPTLVFLGVLYSSVSARFVFFRLFEGTRHKGNHTVLGWTSWACILAVTWVLAFLIAEIIPVFSDLLSVMSSLFDSFFGFIFWGVAYIRIQQLEERKRGDGTRSMRGWIGYIFSWILIIIGLYFLGPGTYASIQSILDNYKGKVVDGVFSCKNNAH